MWKLSPQPLLPDVPDNLPADQYRAEHFGPFVKGKHITWQQWLILRGVEWSRRKKAPPWVSVSSGHGIGKSATEAMLILWFLTCWKNCKVGCTANTGPQLYDILWAEVSLWLRRMPQKVQHWYEWSTEYVRMTDHRESWYARARTSKKEQPEALAGLHADNVAIFVDEASGVFDAVFETAQGALTNPNVLVVMISNPTRLSGFFYDSHHSRKDDWQTFQFDSRDSPIVDVQFVDRIRSTYGEDSPQWKVRVAGEFPDSEEDQLIPRSLFDAAAARYEYRKTDFGAVRCLGVDVARYGGDKTVLAERQGASMGIIAIRSDQDTVATANDAHRAIREAETEGNPFDFVFVDIIGIGSGVFDILMDRQRNGLIPESVRLIPVNASETADEELEHANKRVEMWHRYKKWLEHGAVDPRFREDSCAVKFGKPDSKGRNTLELKEDTKKRLGHSPDVADAGVLTFAIATGRREALPALSGATHDNEVSFGAFG